MYAALLSKMLLDIPPTWQRGELLDVRRFEDGTIKVGRMLDDPKNRKELKFPSSWEAQKFVSHWYAPSEGR